MGLCENCKITMCRAERDDVIGCAEFVAKDTNVLTNADRIRAMTDEELAHFLAWHWNKKDYGLEWLKQPAEVANEPET